MLQLTKNFALEKKYIQGDQTLLNGNGIIYTRAGGPSGHHHKHRTLEFISLED